MAVDPVQRIREQEHETPLALNLPETLARLAALPPSVEAPYLTASLDWRPLGNAPGLRPTRRQFDELAEEVRGRFGPRGTAFDSVSADLDRITTYLDDELDPAAQGVVIVACSHQGVFEPIPLDVPVASDLTTGPTPSLRQLARVVEDYPSYAVIVADQREAFLWVLERRTWQRSVEVSGTDYPRKQMQGGWSQRRYQNRADERIEAFARTVAEETRRAFDEQQIDYLIIGADEIMATNLLDMLHQTVKDKVIGTVSLAITASEQDVLAATEPLVEQAERQRELEAVQQVRDGVGAGGKGVAGPEETLTALQTGQVMTLVMDDDFTSPGWADYTMPLYGVGEVPAEHPAGGDAASLVPVALEDELVRLAIQIGADIEVVQSAVPVGAEEQERIPDADEAPPRAQAALELDALGGVGGVLRYALDAGQPTADL
ncbi:MAG: peptide chain release factor subunit 1 [Thermomicrobiales bacterium]|nr:peptide chain release factor subunit 1 [Thermomicrobiales bacterium]